MQMGSNGTARSFLIESTTERAFGNRAAGAGREADGILVGVATGDLWWDLRARRVKTRGKTWSLLLTQKGNKGDRDGDPDRIPDEDIGASADSKGGSHSRQSDTVFRPSSYKIAICFIRFLSKGRNSFWAPAAVTIFRL